MTIDLGTSSCKTHVYNTNGNILAVASSENITVQKNANLAEQDPNDWLLNVIKTVREVTKKSDIKNQIGVIGLTGFMHSAIPIDKDGNPLSSCLIYTDRRSIKQCKKVSRKISAVEINKITGNRLDPYITAPKLLWIKENKPQVFDKMYKFLPPKDFIRMKLTNKYLTDPIEASGTLLYDIRRKEWSEELLSLFEIPEDTVPPVLESTELAGEITDWASKTTGLKEGTPVIVGAADDIDFLGSGQISPGDTGGSLGSAGEISTCVDKPLHDPLLRIECYPHAIDGMWVIGGSTSAAGTSLKWFKENFTETGHNGLIQNLENSYNLLFEEAQSVEPGAKKLIYLPYLLGERCPIWDAEASGVLFGLKFLHKRKHIIRAIMEGITFSLMNILEVIEGFGIHVESLRFTNQAASSTFWRQMIADVTGKPVLYTDVPQASSFGIMMLALVNQGYYKDIKEACKKLINIKVKQEPNQELHQKYLEYYKLYKKLYHDLKRNFQSLQKI